MARRGRGLQRILYKVARHQPGRDIPSLGDVRRRLPKQERWMDEQQ